MSCLFLTESDVHQLLDMPLVIDVMHEAFRQMAAGKADNVPRVRAKAPGVVLHSMSAAAEYLGLVGWKQYTTTRHGARFHVGLYDAQSGELVALIEANRLGQLRTGAVTGLAAKLLANPGASEVGLFGSGWQAESQLAAVAAACPIQRALVYSRSEEKRMAFARKMSAELNITVTPVDQPRRAVENLPIVVTATTSREPVFDGQWLSPGTLVCAAGSNWLNKAEIDSTTVQRAASVICDSIEACRHEAGDFAAALDEGIFDWSHAVNLSDVVAGKVAARRDPAEIILFKSVGLAIEDVAIGGKLLELARARGLGQTLPM
jgi:alanine dehydrogenase